jgi:hypothetical protein
MARPISIGAALLALATLTSPAAAQQSVRLDTYTCTQFVQDAGSP